LLGVVERGGWDAALEYIDSLSDYRAEKKNLPMEVMQ
jgi:hypothetical protein